MRRTKADAAETREAILVAAEHVFFERGFNASTLDEVAQEAQVTRGAVYWHFASKNEIFSEIYNSARLPNAATMVDLPNCLSEEHDILAAIEDACCEWFRRLACDEQRQRLMTILLRTGLREQFSRVAVELNAINEYRTRYLSDTFAENERNHKLASKWTPDSSSFAVRWLNVGVTNEWLVSGRESDLARDGCDAVHRLFSSFRNHG